MSPNKADKQSLVVSCKRTANAFIAKVKDFTAKIVEINNYARKKYQIQPLLLLLPFAAGILIAGLYGNFGNNNSSEPGHIAMAAAGISSSHNKTDSSGSSKPNQQLLVAQAEPEEQKKPDETNNNDKPSLKDLKLPDTMSPEEVQIFKLFSELAELQEEKGIDSPEVKALNEKLDTLIKNHQINDVEEKSAEPENNDKIKQPETVNKKTAAKPKPATGILPKINGKVNPPRTIIEKKNEIIENQIDGTKAPGTKTTIPVPTRTTTKTTPTKPVDTSANTTIPGIAAQQNKTQEQAIAAEKEKTEIVIEKLPSDSIRIQTKDDRIDLSELLLTVGKELELNFWYEDGQVPSSSIILQQYGTIKREELLPLLTSVLAKCNPPYMMIKEGPYTKIMKMNEIQKNTGIFTPDLDEEFKNIDDTIVATVITLKNIDYNSTLKPILDKFIPSSDIITEIPNTNKIVIADYSRNIKRINDIIAMVDVAGPEKKLEIIVPTYLKPEDTKKILEDMYNKLYGEEGVSSGSDDSSSDSTDRDPNRFEGMSPADRARAIAAERRQQAINNARNRNNNTKPVTNSNAGNSVAASITVDKRTGRLFIIGTESELKNIKHILSLFDVPKGGQQVELKIYSPVYLDSQNAVDKIQKLMKAINEEQAEQEQADSPDPEPTPPTTNRTNRTPTQRRTNTQAANDEQVDGMFMLVDDRTNRIIILGWKEQVEQFEELLALFDIPLPGGEITLQILKLENTEAADTLAKVKELLNAINEQSTGKAPGTSTVTGRPAVNRTRTPNRGENNTQESQNSNNEEDTGPFMLADERLNRILIVGVQEQIDQARELLEIIDQEWPNSEIRLQIFNFDVVEVEAITEQITQLIEALSSNTEDDPSRSSVDRSQSSDIFGTNPRQQNRNISDNSNRSSSPSLQQIGEEGPFLMADNRLNRLFVVGMDDQIRQVDDMIKILDKSIGLKLQIVPQFKYILSSNAADQISRLLAVLHEQEQPQSGSNNSRSNRNNSLNNRNNNNRNSLNPFDDSNNRNNNSANRGTNSGYNRREGISSIIEVSQRGPFLLPDDRTNRLLVVSNNEQYNEIVDLLPVIDVPPSKHDNMTLEIHQLQYVPVSDVRDILDDLELTQTSESLDQKYTRYGPGSARSLTGQTGIDTVNGRNIIIEDMNAWTNIEEPIIYVAQHEPTNRLFIYATLYQHEEISEMIKVIDVEPDDTLGQVKVFKMRNQEPSVISGAITSLYIEPLEKQNQVSDGETNLKGLEVAPTVHELSDIFSVAVRGSKRQLEEIESIINDIDIPMPQVLIEASLIKITLDDSFKLGVTLKDVFALPDGSSISGISPFSVDGVSIGDSGVATGIGGTVAFFNENFVYAAMEAINTNTNSEISSMPRVLTLDNKAATITSSVSRPIERTTIPIGSDTPITEVAEWKEAGTTLSVTPHIGVFDNDPNNDDAFLRLEITLDVDNFIGEGNDTSTANNNITSHVNIPNGAYIILGGLTQTSWTESENKIPLLGDIPILGAAFRNISKTKGRTVLYVFVKAEIVSDQNFNQLKALSQINEDKMRELQENFNEMPIIPGFMPEKRERIN